MYYIPGSSKVFTSARECAADFFHSDVVVFMPLIGLWFDVATGQTCIVESVSA